jgi:hypothetical protein
MQLRKRMLIGAILVVATIGLSIASSHKPFQVFDTKAVRTIILTARDMKFNANNPDFAIEPGKMVRVVLRNEDPGMKHDLVIPDIGIRTPVLQFGEEAVLEFRAPDTRMFEYFCSMHSVLMRGRFFVGEMPGAELTEESL